MDANTTTKASYKQPALIGGAVMGVLSALPVISAGNICCCLWVVIGGVVAAYMLQQNQSAPISAGDGAMVGLLAGLLGAVVSLVISIPVTLMLGPVQQALAERALSMGNGFPPEVREAIENAGNPSSFGFAGMLLFQFLSFFVMLFAGAVFSTLGGLLGAAIFAKKSNGSPSPI